MKAKEMFEELGYEGSEYQYKIVYKMIINKKCGENEEALPKEIIFWKDLKTIDFKYGRLGSYIYLELLQAINQQCKELGWLEDK